MSRVLVPCHESDRGAHDGSCGAWSRGATCLAIAVALVVLPGSVEAQSLLPTLSKSFSPPVIGPGSVSTLELTISNPTSSPVRGLAVTDTLPAGVMIATPSNLSTTCRGSVSGPAGGTTVSLSDGAVAGGGSCGVTVNVTSSTPGTHTNVTGDLVSDAGTSSGATADLVVATDRPGFAKSFAPGSVSFAERSTLVFTIDNSANSNAASFLAFSDTLPGGMVVASPANASTTCADAVVQAPEGGSVVSLASAIPMSATVAAGASCTVSVDVVTNGVGPIGNISDELTSSVGFGPAVSSGKASAVLNVSITQLALTKAFVADPVAPGSDVTLRFEIFNLDRNNPASGVTFGDDLDAMLAGATASDTPLVDPCGAGSSLSGSSFLTLTGGVIPANSSCTFDIVVSVPPSAATGSYLNTTSAVSAELGGRPASGDPASELLFVEPVPSLDLDYTDDPVGAGGTATLEMTLSNSSAVDGATDLGFSIEFDQVVTGAASTPAAGFCGAGSSLSVAPATAFEPTRLTVAEASLAAGGSCTFSVGLEIAVGAQGGFFSTVSSPVSGTVAGVGVTGPAAADTLEIYGAPLLLKEFVDDPVSPGGTATLRFTISTGEEAAAEAQAITFSDDLDATLSGLVAVGLPATDVCGPGSSLSGDMTLTLTGGVVAPGEACSFPVTVEVPPGAPVGPATNTTSSLVATVAGVEAIGAAATDDLVIAGLSLTKEFVDDPVVPGETVTLRFTLANQSQDETASDITFLDNLDQTLDGLTATGLPLADICGAGSTVTGVAGDSALVLQGASLQPESSCSFDVTLQVPAGARSDTYVNVTDAFTATVGGRTVPFPEATDFLVVSDDLLSLTKEFVDDPVGPGDTTTLRFTVSHLGTGDPITDIAFTDDLEAALPGLASVSGTVTDPCGPGSELDGSGLLTLSGGSLPAGASCSFDVELSVPTSVALGTVATNTTSQVTGLVGGFAVDGDAASDELRIEFVRVSKGFAGEANAGDVVALTFTIENLSGSESVTGLELSDDLGAALSGLAAIGLPASEVCGVGSEVAGTSVVQLTGGSLLPGASCSFAVDVQVPGAAAPGDYLNITSSLRANGLEVAAPATATLTVVELADSDDDGVLDGDDVCPQTLIPEGVPTRSLGVNRYALVDGDTLFDTVRPPGGGPGDVFTTTDTAGCSCEQIIDRLGLGAGHEKFGCSLGAMRSWVAQVGPAKR